MLNHKLIFFCLSFLSVFSLNAQEKGRLRQDVLKSQQASEPKTAKKSARPAVTPKNLVYLIHADYTIGDEENLPGIQLLKGNVCFKHDNALMYCDSAFFYENKNSLDAYDNVRIIQADTLFVYANFLFYDGNTRLAQLRENVKMENKNAVLTTDSLNYDRNTSIGYYFTGGKIVDNTNTLTSIWGQYSTATEIAIFRNDVVLTNPDYKMLSDTLHYNTKTKVANIVGQTHIIYQNETDIYSTRGWYNTDNECSILLDRSLVVHQNGKTLTGDSIFYDKKNKYGEGFSKMELTDSVQQTTLYGDYVFYDEKTESSFATDSALLVYWEEPDDKAYIHADTLEMKKDSVTLTFVNEIQKDSIRYLDSLKTQFDTVFYKVKEEIRQDTVFDKVFAYHNVRIYRSDLQAICDSMTYSTQDSVINMYGLPVSWAEGSQMSGNEMQVFTKNNEVYRVEIHQSAMISQSTDSAHYFNQLSGKEIVAHIDSGKIRLVNVNGNAETLYFPIDDSDSTMIGMNVTQSGLVNMYFSNKKIDRIVYPTPTTGKTTPLFQLVEGNQYLKNFFWLSEQQPKTPQDVFLVFPKTERVMPAKESKKTEGQKVELPAIKKATNL